MLHTKFHGNRPVGSREEVMWPASCHQIVISLYLKAFIQKFVPNGTVVSEKIWFEYLYVHDLVPRSRNSCSCKNFP